MDKKKNAKPEFPFGKKGADEKQQDKKTAANSKPLPNDKNKSGKKPVEKKAPTGKKKSCK